jgi:uncharacterized protein (DUF433 family)
MDWSGCPEVERRPGKVSGQWLVMGTRILADELVANARDGYTPEDLVHIFEGLPVERARRILAWAWAHAEAPPA